MKILVLLCSLLVSTELYAERIKDLASLAGVRENQLVGYGLVVGLNGSGDQTTQTPFTVQSLKSMLNQLGIVIPPNVNPQLKNVAAVMVHASLPPFARPGQTIDVTVASIGNAKELRGGSLLMTPMRGADGEVYALAQGNLIVGGFGAQGADGSSVTVNIPTSGRIPNGAIVEREVYSPFASADSLMLQLNTADFSTANQLMNTINTTFGAGTAFAMNSNSVKVLAPAGMDARVSFVATLENLDVQAAMGAAKVIVNSRTGTVVIGSHVRVSPAAIAHGNLVVTVSENYSASQPGAFARRGETAIVADSNIQIDQEGNGMFLFEPGVSLDEIVKAVNRVGAAPGDLVAILEALQQVGALRAQLIVIKESTAMSAITPAALTPMDFAGMASLRSQAHLNQDDATIKEVATQFESLFVQMALKSMREATPKDELFGGDQMELYQDMHDKQMALELSRSGGLGLAKLIEAQLQSPAATKQQ